MTPREKAFRLKTRQEIATLKAQIAYDVREIADLRSFARVADNHRMQLIIQLLELGHTPRVYRPERER